MSQQNLQQKLSLLDSRSKAVRQPNSEEFKIIQQELDELAENLDKYANKSDFEYVIYEIQARLHLIGGRYDEAENFCNEAIRLVGEEYPDGLWLKNVIAKERSLTQKVNYSKYLLSDSQEERKKFESYFWFAVVGLLIIVPLCIGLNNSNSQKSEMITTCGDDITQSQNVISSLNDSLDHISSDASGYVDSDYETLQSTLENIESTASGAKQSPPATQCE